MASPVEQFEIKEIVSFGAIGDAPLALTNSGLYMLIVVGVILGVMSVATRNVALIPNRWQSFGETLYEFVANMLRDAAGKEGMTFFPLVFSLFLFVLVGNLVGMVPGAFTITSHIIVTFALAMLVIGTVVIFGLVKHGLHFFGLFVPSGVPAWLLPFISLIEVISFLSRPISLSLRLFANMLAGHIALKVFATFIVSLLGAGGLVAVLSPLPLLMTFAMVGFEIFVAALQAYVFAVLTCIYLNDALHPGH
ncbi:F0F1 ATP synthase subunit A [Salinarimonas sp.]|uniref:F0F1 ATP synthase subunit A n=1 Tax=Salinarimonas sp. TaxID=2766526 RepID=UPI0032D8F50A